MKHYWIFVLLALVLGSCKVDPSSSNAERVSAMDRVLSTQKIRCSYLLYTPYLNKDPNTGELSGIFFEVMQHIGKNSELEIEWVEEVGYENIFTGLESEKHDVFAGGLWPNGTRAKAASFTIPVFYSVIKAWVRQNETRIQSLDQVNSSSVRIATIDGAMEDLIARIDFPNAARVSLPQLSPFSQNLLNITTNKADITFAEPGVIYEFMKNNPQTIKELVTEKPLRTFGNSLVVKQGELELRDFLDHALREILYDGTMDRILERYEPGPDAFPRVALPYSQ